MPTTVFARVLLASVLLVPNAAALTLEAEPRRPPERFAVEVPHVFDVRVRLDADEGCGPLTRVRLEQLQPEGAPHAVVSFAPAEGDAPFDAADGTYGFASVLTVVLNRSAPAFQVEALLLRASETGCPGRASDDLAVNLTVDFDLRFEAVAKMTRIGVATDRRCVLPVEFTNLSNGDVRIDSALTSDPPADAAIAAPDGTIVESKAVRGDGATTRALLMSYFTTSAPGTYNVTWSLDVDSVVPARNVTSASRALSFEVVVTNELPGPMFPWVIVAAALSCALVRGRRDRR